MTIEAMECEIAKLREEKQMLQDRIEELESVLFCGAPDGVALFGLPPAPSRILAFVAGRQIATKEAIWTALYSAGVDDAPEIKTIDVHVHRIRRAIAPFGLLVATVWGSGYRMSPEHREAVKAEILRASGVSA